MEASEINKEIKDHWTYLVSKGYKPGSFKFLYHNLKIIEKIKNREKIYLNKRERFKVELVYLCYHLVQLFKGLCQKK